ncbi:MAG: DUF1883 domain-containing protein [Pseudomonadota bacterium]
MWHYDVGHLNGNDAVEVELDCQANVLLMDSVNFAQYRHGGRCPYYGGRALRSPVRLAPPRAGRWHVVIDGVARVRARVSTLRG